MTTMKSKNIQRVDRDTVLSPVKPNELVVRQTFPFAFQSYIVGVPGARALRPGGSLLPFLIVVLFASFALATMTACASGPEVSAESSPQQSPHPPKALALYESVLAVYEERDLEVEVASRDMLLVSSPYEKVSGGIRRRTITRVLPFGRNVALNVVVEYQEREAESSTLWAAVSESSDWMKRAATEELEIGRAVERHFHRHQRRRR